MSVHACIQHWHTSAFTYFTFFHMNDARTKAVHLSSVHELQNEFTHALNRDSLKWHGKCIAGHQCNEYVNEHVGIRGDLNL